MFGVRARRATVHVPRISFHVPEFRFMCPESPQPFLEGYHQQQHQHHQHHFVPAVPQPWLHTGFLLPSQIISAVHHPRLSMPTLLSSPTWEVERKLSPGVSPVSDHHPSLVCGAGVPDHPRAHNAQPGSMGRTSLEWIFFLPLKPLSCGGGSKFLTFLPSGCTATRQLVFTAAPDAWVTLSLGQDQLSFNWHPKKMSI